MKRQGGGTGFIAGLHHKMDTETAMRFAQASAALVATGLGSDAGIVSFAHTMFFGIGSYGVAIAMAKLGVG